jgi:Domain of unknown function (DUF4286)
MIVFNITCHIEKNIKLDFVNWLKTEFSTNLNASSFIFENTLLKLLTEIDDQTFTYSIQLSFENWLYYQQFQLEEEGRLLLLLQKKFEGKIFTFTTVLEKV